MNENLTPKPGGWCEIEIANMSGDPIKVRARTVKPFAVHRDPSGTWWKVTHLYTGCSIGQFDDIRTAVSFASRLRKAAAENPLRSNDPVTVTEELIRAGAGALRKSMGGFPGRGPIHTECVGLAGVPHDA